MPYADVNHERLYYEVRGEGPPLVLIRGLSRSMRFWSETQRDLEKYFTVLAFDHRGIGRSEIRGHGFLLPDMARDLAALIDHVGWKKAHVFGLSLGGMIAQHLALNHPEKVDKLVLASTWAGGKDATFPSIKSLLVLAVGGRLPPRFGVKVQAPRLLSPTFAKKNPHVTAAWVPHLRHEPPHPKVVLRQAISGALHDVTTRLQGLKIETLVLAGDADRLISPKNSDHLASLIPGAQLKVLPGVGHEVMTEAPEQTIEILRAFFLPSSENEHAA